MIVDKALIGANLAYFDQDISQSLKEVIDNAVAVLNYKTKDEFFFKTVEQLQHSCRWHGLYELCQYLVEVPIPTRYVLRETSPYGSTKELFQLCP
jgi:hypothetical protein